MHRPSVAGTCIYIYGHTLIYIHTYTHTHMHTLRLTCTYIHTLTLTCMVCRDIYIHERNTADCTFVGSAAAGSLCSARYVCICVCVCVHICVCDCVCMHKIWYICIYYNICFISIHIHKYGICIYNVCFISIQIHTYIHACVHTYTYMRIHECVCACTCICTCLSLSLSLSLSHVRTAYIHTRPRIHTAPHKRHIKTTRAHTLSNTH
jgi:hypothetical protein